MSETKRCKYEVCESTFIPTDDERFDDGQTYRGYWKKDSLPACTRFQSIDEQVRKTKGYRACGGCGKRCAFFEPAEPDKKEAAKP